ncbi:hypothetical protein BU15DRAFT_61319 [Melanogaster broomeanus]|nr:hypothetical protein BU15DRAFT_61319 [Melanogaster broomeanus]
MASPALSVIASVPAASSPNDPFRAIVVKHRTQQPEPPLCCLKLPPAVDPPEGREDVLISFEEWKSKQFQAHSHPPVHSRIENSVSDGMSKSSGQHTETPPVDAHAHAPPPDPVPSYPEDTLPPHFRVPITDRFNYANIDCSARVHMSHKSAKSPSAILSSTKDKYMLSPCTTKHGEAQFVVVELCDDIRIDTVQMADFEFFSGVFKDFSSFHLPTSLRDFYRYIRIDFHSHYGNEYYCPVSLLRVYGLTHLEEWKWEMWEAESHQRWKDAGAQQPFLTEGSLPMPTEDIKAFMDKLDTAPIHPSAAASLPPEGTSTVSLKSPSSSSSIHSQSPKGVPASVVREVPISDAGDGGQHIPAMHAIIASSSVLEAIASPASVMSSSSAAAPSTPSGGEYPNSHSQTSEAHAVTTLSTRPTALSTLSHSQQPSAHTALSPIQAQGSGESIYRTIMNRLTVLEANHTLYARYVEEQTAGVREVLRKLGEEVGRLDSVGRMQAQMYQRTVHEWERQRLRLQVEHGELLSRVNYLSDEVVFEKRLGIAQLCLLLAVLVFMGFTRGAPTVEHPQPVLNRSARQWGIRNLSFGSSREGGWNPIKLRSRSSTEQNTGARTEKATDTHVAFPAPIQGAVFKTDPHTSTFSLRQSPKPFKSASASTLSLTRRSHTPSSFHTPTKTRPAVVSRSTHAPSSPRHRKIQLLEYFCPSWRAFGEALGSDGTFTRSQGCP